MRVLTKTLEANHDVEFLIVYIARKNVRNLLLVSQSGFLIENFIYSSLELLVGFKIVIVKWNRNGGLVEDNVVEVNMAQISLCLDCTLE